MTRRGKVRPCLRIVRKLFAALDDPAGVVAHRRGGFERIGWLIQDWDTARGKLADTEARMVAVLDELALTELACSIEGLSPVGAAAILAQTGDLRRFTSARAVVKHAGLAPRERMSGTFTGRARLTGAGRPALRVAAWRAIWAAPAEQPGLRRPLPPPDHPRGQQAHPDPGPDRDRRGDPAPAVRRRGQRTGLGPRSSPPTAPEPRRGWLRRNEIRARQDAARPQAWVGASLPRH